jgi:GMP synthase-like glutamine amidotransferase
MSDLTLSQPNGRVLVFQHLDCEHPGIFRDFLAQDGLALDTIKLDQGEAIPDDFAPWSAMLVMGGPMDVWDEERLPWLTLEKQAIRRWLATQKPYLGFCLGHQLLADAAGGRVELMPRPDVGIRQVTLTSAGKADALLGGLPATIDCLQWHGAAVTQLPPDAVVLAESDITPHEAIRVGGNAWGIQFHTEITDATVGEWNMVPEYTAALQKILGPGGEHQFARDVTDALPRLANTAGLIYTALRARMGDISLP